MTLVEEWVAKAEADYRSAAALNLGVSGVAGKFCDDAELREIRDDIYRQRDAERPQ